MTEMMMMMSWLDVTVICHSADVLQVNYNNQRPEVWSHNSVLKVELSRAYARWWWWWWWWWLWVT